MKTSKMYSFMMLVIIAVTVSSTVAFAAPDHKNPSQAGTSKQVFCYRNAIESSTSWISNGNMITVRFMNLKCSEGSGYVDIAMYQYDCGWQYVATRTVYVSTNATAQVACFPCVKSGVPVYFKLYGIGGPTINGEMLPY